MKKRNSNLFIIILIGVFIISLIIVKSFALEGENNNIIDVSAVTVDEKFLAQMNEKELLYYKILNSIDFYETVEGILVSGNNKTNENETIKFIVDMKNKKAYYNEKSDDLNEEIIINGSKRIMIDHVKKEYRIDSIDTYDKDKIISRLKPNQRFCGEKITKFKYNNEIREVQGIAFRNDGYLINIRNLFDQEIIGTYLHDYEWNIEKSIEYLGRKATIIKGEMKFVDKYGASVFEAIIDNETGIILSTEFLNKKGEIIKYEKITEGKFNSRVEEKFFIKQLDDYKKIN